MGAVTFFAETSPARFPPRLLFLAFETAVGKRLITDPTAVAHRLVMNPEARVAHHRLSGTSAFLKRTCPYVNPFSLRIAVFASILILDVGIAVVTSPAQTEEMVILRRYSAANIAFPRR